MPKSNCVPFRTSPEKFSPDRSGLNGDIVSCGCDCCGWFGVDFSWEVMICWVLVDTPTKTGWWNVSDSRTFQSRCLNRAWFLPLLQKMFTRNKCKCSQCTGSVRQSSISQLAVRLAHVFWKQTKKTEILHVGEGKHQLKIGKLMEVGIRRYYLWYRVAQIQGIFRKLIILTSAPGKRNEWNNNFWGDTFQLPPFLTSHGFVFSPSGNFGQILHRGRQRKHVLL